LFTRKESIIVTDHISHSVYRYAKSVGAKHFHTSAKLNQGIEEMFLELSQKMIERTQENDQQKASSLGRLGSTRRNVVVVEDDDEAAAASQAKSGCCGGVSTAS
jgi:Ras-related protein Rab-21